MYAIHAWFQLSETTSEDDVGGLDAALGELRRTLADWDADNIRPALFVLNGTHYVTIFGDTNRDRPAETAQVWSLVD